MTAIDVILDGLLIAVAGTGAVTDVYRRKIYDWLTIPAILAGLILQTSLFGLGGVFDRGLVSSLFGAAFSAVLFGVFWMWRKGFGAGDVKLMVALGALAGFLQAMTIAMCVTICGAVLGLVYLVLRKRLTREGAERGKLPYGLAIGLGVLWALLIKHRVFAGFF